MKHKRLHSKEANFSHSSVQNKLLDMVSSSSSILQPSIKLETKNFALSASPLLVPMQQCSLTTRDRKMRVANRAFARAESGPIRQQALVNLLQPVSLEGMDWDMFGNLAPTAFAETEEADTTDASITAKTFTEVTGDVSSTSLEAIKVEILQSLATSLVDGRKLKDSSVRNRLSSFVEICTKSDPEFVLKAALYCRRELNIRTASNFMLAIAFHHAPCYPYASKYFSATVRLPSDWLDVLDAYKAFRNEGSRAKLPRVLRTSLTAKFAEFDLYQLAKYNKNPPKKSKSKKPNQTKPISAPSTMKSVIRTLHISSPTFAVMCILGKKYPQSPSDFFKAGLEGEFDPSLAGKRMKLPTPDTWETVLSSQGNNASSWESLIVPGKLPYMAMLRNLRNILKSGVSDEVHRLVVKKLTNPRAVAESKQMPFRFYSAYKTLEQLKRKIGFNAFLCRLKVKPQRRPAHRVRSPSTKSQTTKMKSWASKAEQYKFGESQIELYQQALNLAIDISVQNNVPPIRGSVLVVCTQMKDPDKAPEKRKPMLLDAWITSRLLALMCVSAAESPLAYVSDFNSNTLVRLDNDKESDRSLLTRAMAVVHGDHTVDVHELVRTLIANRQHFETVFVVGPLPLALMNYVSVCRRHFGPVNAVWSDVMGTDLWPTPPESEQDWFVARGITDMVLRYMAEATKKSLLAQVEKIDEQYGLNEPPRIVAGKDALRRAATAPLAVDRPLTDWRCCRVFVSSTFRDMHAERDLVCGLLFPSIRRIAARKYHLHVTEVDLRWGVPESLTHSGKSLQMCLEQATDADFLVLLLADRYGWVPKPAAVQALPPQLLRRINKFYEPGMSVTEMEYRIVKQSILEKIPAQQKKKFAAIEKGELVRRLFVFIRDSAATVEVPPEHLPEFRERSQTKQERLNHFKDLVRADGTVVMDGYPAFYNGIVAGRPVMGNLTTFAERLHRCLCTALGELYSKLPVTGPQTQSLELRPTHEQFVSTFVMPVASAIAPRQLLLVERSFADLDTRGKQCRSLRRFAEQKASSRNSNTRPVLSSKEHDGTILLLTGSIGCGKTTHLAALVASLVKPGWRPSQYQEKAQVATTNSGTTRTSAFTQGESDMATMISQRPKLTSATVLVHFAQGLPITGLPPKTALLSMLDDWIARMMSIAETIDSCPQLMRSRVDVASTKASAPSGASAQSADQILQSKVNNFLDLLKLFSCFVDANFVFMVDDCDKLKPALFDWLPAVIPQNVRFVVSCDSNSPVAREIASRPDCLALTISGLSNAERAAAIRSLFGRYGKVLDETGFKNQVSMLVNKRNAEIPLYLRLACDELRLHGSFEELDSQIRNLPATIPTLVHHIVARTELECGSRLTRAALALICCAQQPLSGSELQSLLDFYLTTRGPIQSSDSRGWAALEENPTLDAEFDVILHSEELISRLLSDSSMEFDEDCRKSAKLPPLAFELLVNNLRPLLAGFGDVADDLDEPEADTKPQAAFGFSNDRSVLRFRSQEIERIITDLIFRSDGLLSAAAVAGYHPTPLRSTPKYSRIDNLGSSEQQAINRTDMHWVLATTGNRLDHMIYHLFHAGKMNTVCRLLTSGVFLTAKFRAGLGPSILEDFAGYGHGDPVLQTLWQDATQVNPIKDRLLSFQRFVSVHNSTLSEYPLLFAQLALNDPLDDWIRLLGSVLNKLNEPTMKRQNMRTLFHRNLLADVGRVHTPKAVCNLNTTDPSRTAYPTAVALDSTGRLLACGTDSGTILLFEATSFRNLLTLFGVGSPVLSCCFISLGQTSSSTFWLTSTAKDGTVSLWELSLGIWSSGRLRLSAGPQILSIGDGHSAPATCCCWHPGRHILATGGLDCRVIIWSLPKSSSELQQLQFASDRPKVPFRSVFTKFGRVSCMAFRLPNAEAAYDTDPEKCDVLAVGSWDGILRIYNLDTLVCVMRLHVSNWALTSVDFSPAGGSVFVTRDLRGRVCLWRSNTFTLLTGDFTNSSPQTCLSDEKVPCNRGHVCFSRPHGRYLIQSGCEASDAQQMLVWNSQLGAAIGPWRIPTGLATSQEHITSFAVDRFGHIAVLGSSDGRILFVCTRTNRVLPSNLPRTATVRAQCVTCYVPSTDRSVLGPYKLNVAVGYTSGFVYVYSCRILKASPLPSGPGGQKSQYCDCEVHGLILLNKHGSHSEDSREDSVAYSGGTLCVGAANCVVASGGGNAQCAVNFFKNSTTDDVNSSSLVVLNGLQSAVTAVDVASSLLAVGTKMRLLRLYRLDLANQTATILAQIPHASNDWITALAVSDCPRAPHRRIREQTPDADDLPLVIVGSLDHTVRAYQIENESELRLVEALNGPGGAVTCLSACGRYFAAGSANGSVRVWNFKTPSQPEEVTTMHLDSTTGSSSDSTSVTYLRLLYENRSFKDSPNQLDKEMPEVTIRCQLEPKQNASTDPSTWESTELRLVAGQSLPSTSARSSATDFRYGLFAPLLTECRAVLQGHLGAVPTGLATAAHAEWPDDSLLVSVAGSVTAGVADIRLWNLQDSDSSSKPANPLHHQSSISCMAITVSDEAKQLCFTGGSDGALVLWHSIEASSSHRSGSTSNSHPDSWWDAVAKVQFSSTAPIRAIAAPSKYKGRIVIAAVGNKVIVLHLHKADAFENLRRWGIVDEQILSSSELLATLGIKYSEQSLVDGVVDFCVVNGDNECSPTSVMFSFANGILGFATFDDLLTNLSVSLSEFMNRPRPRTLDSAYWTYSLNAVGRSVVGIRHKHPFALENKQDTQPTPIDVLSGDQSMVYESIIPLGNFDDLQSGLYMVVCVSSAYSCVQLLNTSSAILASSECYRPPVQITATGYYQDPESREDFLIVVATSDGLLHVFEYTMQIKPTHQGGALPDHSRLQKVGLYSTGERITKLSLVRKEPFVQVIAGCQNGRLNTYDIC